ncbi:Os11g0686900 [Oryza sativa Japonica Group]|uniref:Os11g0686900 protein n=1 Tax=Oryza sativa subsp. japonica TaxID=39947 RepID=A0A0N7KTD1_ORYSJ|nr:Os11g0686900 [Oryza sativa Japonica Group]
MEAPTCGLWGAVLNLPGRLDGVLLRHGSILPKGAEEEIPLIKRDLHLMISILNGYYSESPELEDATATTVARRRCWTKEVRELSYDIEDCIDHYEHAATAGSAGGRTASGGIPPRRKITRRRWQRTTPLWIPERLKQRLWMANKIREFSLRAQDALKRHAMFCSSVGGNGIATSTASSSTAATGDASSSSSTICWHTTRFRERDFCVPHVGINVAMNKLEDWLTACDDEDQKRLRVVSIVGVGGIGKTTLANELYRKLRRQFECWAFVRSSQKPDVRRILISILSQLRLQQPPESWKTATKLSDKVRRLSLHFGNVKDAKLPINMRLSQVRTLAFFGAYKYWWRSIKDQFPLLQVLILHFWHDEDIISFDLTIISQLFRLKYLKITSDVTLELQTKTRGLQCLETLKIDARISTAPLDTTHLSGLLHLSLPADTNLANGIGHMTSLHTFGYFDLSYNSVENVLSLGKLTNLRNLQLTCSTIRPNSLEIKLQCLGFILQKLSNLKSVTMSTAGSSCVNSTDASSANVSVRISGDGLSSMSSPPALVERLELLPRICIFSYLPKWISLLSKLRILKIGVRELVRNDIDVLMGLRALTDLSLHVHTKPTEIIFFGGIGFKALKYLKINCCVAWLKFDMGAMHSLYKLKLGYNVDGVDQESTIPVGIQYLYGLKEISVKIGGADPEKYDRRAEELAFMIDSGLHDRCMSITLQCVRQMFDFNEDKSSLTHEEQRKLKQQEILEDDSDEEYDEIIQDSGEQEVKQSTLSEWDIVHLLRNKLNNQQDGTTCHFPVVASYYVDTCQLTGGSSSVTSIKVFST